MLFKLGVGAGGTGAGEGPGGGGDDLVRELVLELMAVQVK